MKMAMYPGQVGKNAHSQEIKQNIKMENKISGKTKIAVNITCDVKVFLNNKKD